MKTAVALLVLVMTLAAVQEAAAKSSSYDRPRIGHHSGQNGPSKAGWGGGGAYHK